MTDASPGLVDVLSLERIEADLFRSQVVYDDPFGLYGGQVAAQALRAAAQTVDPDDTRTRCMATSSAGAIRHAACC